MGRIAKNGQKSIEDGLADTGKLQVLDYPRGQRVLRSREVSVRVGLSRTTVWRLRQQGDFPAPRQLSANAMGWTEEEIDQWIASRHSKGKPL
jgi:prophage regulatory protein